MSNVHKRWLKGLVNYVFAFCVFQSKCILGQRAKEEFTKLDALERLSVETTMKKCLSAVCTYLLKNLPMEVQNIRDTRYLHPALHGSAKALEAIERLALEVFNGLGDEAFQKVFGEAMHKHDICDVIRREMTEFQTEKIPESYFAKDEQTVRALVTKASYWAKCYK